ncbi:glyoxalase domain-containing protein 4-like isoform X3 [Varroa jacobsoni]|nr:glyoxalase domain-containing protein 4-like isoform X3 [Varroa jacobsoni]
MASNAHLRRALHYVFKIPDRSLTMRFYTDVLLMRVLRHEEFEKGCLAACNGRYDGFWSKTMVGYGSEDDHFAMELIYNYGVDKYKKGNEFKGIVIQMSNVLKRAQENRWTVQQENDKSYVEAPGGFKFYVEEDSSERKDPVRQVIYSCTNVEKTRRFWVTMLGCEVVESGDDFLEVAYDKSKTSLRFEKIFEPIDRGEAYGRVAFACPRNQLPEIEAQVKNADIGTVITPLVSLETPGKASVEVVILGDPDGHEICFVGDEGFHELSKEDPEASQVLQEKMKEYDAYVEKVQRRDRHF